jgi:exodeoxyribonuclease VII small subunit
MTRRAPSAPEPTEAAQAGPSFEVAIKRLTEIVATLERGDLSLEESLRLFEEGVQLSRVSQKRLDTAEKRVEQLLSVDEQGRATTAAFTTTAEEEGDGPEEAPF